MVVTNFSVLVLGYNCIGLLWSVKSGSICKLLESYVIVYFQILKFNCYSSGDIDTVIEEKKR